MLETAMRAYMSYFLTGRMYIRKLNLYYIAISELYTFSTHCASMYQAWFECSCLITA